MHSAHGGFTSPSRLIQHFSYTWTCTWNFPSLVHKAVTQTPKKPGSQLHSRNLPCTPSGTRPFAEVCRTPIASLIRLVFDNYAVELLMRPCMTLGIQEYHTLQGSETNLSLPEPFRSKAPTLQPLKTNLKSQKGTKHGGNQ